MKDPFVWILTSLICLGAILGCVMVAMSFQWSGDPGKKLLDFAFWSDVAQIVTALSVAYAAGTYKLQTKQNRSVAIANHVRSFREVICLGENVTPYLRKTEKLLDMKLVAVEMIDEFSASWFFEKRPRETTTQNLFWTGADILEPKARAAVTALLNALEELSINIKATDTVLDDDLLSIRRSFVSYVEAFAWPMVLSGPYSKEMYPGIRFLYQEWYRQIDRIPRAEIQKRIEKDIKASLKSNPSLFNDYIQESDKIQAVITSQSVKKED